jgi:ubiquinone/menaquinone biosynthesis C-methylase UbiE
MQKFNLLEVSSDIKRNLSVRANISYEDRVRSSKFDFDYFDGDRALGYGGYKYDGRWVKVAKRAVEFFGLRAGDRVLDVGCGKGFFVNDLKEACQLDAFGVVISDYAIKNAMPSVVGRLHLQDMREFSFPDASFDAIFCVNTLHNLDKVDAYRAVKEMHRVLKNRDKIFIQVDAYRNKLDLEIFEKWVLTAKMYLQPDEWLKFFHDCGYSGAYYWTILNSDGSVE